MKDKATGVISEHYYLRKGVDVQEKIINVYVGRHIPVHYHSYVPLLCALYTQITSIEYQDVQFLLNFSSLSISCFLSWA